MGELMQHRGMDEMLAAGVDTGAAPTPMPQMVVTNVESASDSQSLLGRLEKSIGDALRQPLSPDHKALLESGAEPSADDIALAASLLHVEHDH